MAVEAGRLAISDGPAVDKLVFVSRDLPLLEGGNTAPLIAALRLGHSVQVTEQIGGAPATLDALTAATPNTLVIAADASGSVGAAAALVKSNPLTLAARVQRSMPQRTRLLSGQVFSDDDPRMLRELGVHASMNAARLASKPLVLAGVGAKAAAPWSAPNAPVMPTLGASSVLFALAALVETGRGGLVAAIEQAALTASHFDSSDSSVRRNERAVQPSARREATPGSSIKISLAAYVRAYEAKVRWQAGKCTRCGTLAMPPRYHCLECGADDTWVFSPLPYTGTVYTTTTVHVPVPSLESPYSLAVVQCDGSDVRVLVHVTDVPPSTAKIGARGRVVLRRVAMRSGVPDYGHAFSPDLVASHQSRPAP
jgi:uncharacterized OB-fold protein